MTGGGNQWGWAAALALAAGTAGADLTPARRAELLQLLQQDCGSCHGLTLKGGLGPALTPQALAGKDPYTLRQTILDGRHGTPMAPWKLFLNEQEADWLVEQLLKGVPDGR
jgi:cytochrome c55X